MDINKIPGLIESIEVKGLHRAASQLLPDDQIIEFGCYLGKSTQAILNGIPDELSNIEFLVYDQYCVHAKDRFSKTLVSHVKKVELLDDLYFDKQKGIHWEKVFDKLVRPPNNVNMQRTKTRLAEVKNRGVRSIGLMHIDAPKSYKDFKPILYKFFPLLRKEAKVIFQDFFYHWSPTLIIFVEILRQMKLIEIVEGRASSLEVMLTKSISEKEILGVDLIMDAPNLIKFIVDSLVFFKNNKGMLDRPEVFLPRVKLAKLLYAKNIGENAIVVDTLASFAKEGEVTPHLYEALVELIGKDFDIEYFLK